MNSELLALEKKIGLVGYSDFQQTTDLRQNGSGFACDAQPALITTSNAGIPGFLSTFIDPKIIEVLVAPMKAAEIVGSEVKKGDFTTQTAMFPVVESTGQASTYGDYNENGVSGANFTFPQRQSYTYQVMTNWGEVEMERAGLTRIDWANRVNLASVLTLNKFQNKSYFYGVSGIQSYGLLNDPSLSSALTPKTKAAGGTSWSVAVADEILADIQKLYIGLQTQAKGTIDLDTPMTLAMSSIANGYIANTTAFNVSVVERLKNIYKNMKIVSAPEYSTDSGELVQLIVRELDGQPTASCAFTEKLRAHPVIVGASSFKQKKSQGTFGTVIFRPFLISQMIGV